jgi:hypothetical protein
LTGEKHSLLIGKRATSCGTTNIRIIESFEIWRKYGRRQPVNELDAQSMVLYASFSIVILLLKWGLHTMATVTGCIQCCDFRSVEYDTPSDVFSAKSPDVKSVDIIAQAELRALMSSVDDIWDYSYLRQSLIQRVTASAPVEPGPLTPKIVFPSPERPTVDAMKKVLSTEKMHEVRDRLPQTSGQRLWISHVANKQIDLTRILDAPALEQPCSGSITQDDLSTYVNLCKRKVYYDHMRSALTERLKQGARVEAGELTARIERMPERGPSWTQLERVLSQQELADLKQDGSATPDPELQILGIEGSSVI